LERRFPVPTGFPPTSILLVTMFNVMRRPSYGGIALRQTPRSRPVQLQDAVEHVLTITIFKPIPYGRIRHVDVINLELIHGGDKATTIHCCHHWWHRKNAQTRAYVTNDGTKNNGREQGI
jgi:hypothetical protein